MRIVAGALRGRPIVAPKGHSTRPTADRVRQAIFDILEHAPFSPPMKGLASVDLFAGSGAMGLEALSARGRLLCLFAETPTAPAPCGDRTQPRRPRPGGPRAGPGPGRLPARRRPALRPRLPRSALWLGPGRSGASGGSPLRPPDPRRLLAVGESRRRRPTAHRARLRTPQRANLGRGPRAVPGPAVDQDRAKLHQVRPAPLRHPGPSCAAGGPGTQVFLKCLHENQKTWVPDLRA